jgi:phage major head subunit gpT-like protein
MRRASEMGRKVAKSYDTLAVATLEAGTSTACYDGQNFFSTTHGDGLGATQSNYASSGKAFSATTIKEAINEMSLFEDDNGQLAGMSATHWMVPSGLRFPALEVVNPNVLAAVTDETKRSLAGSVEIIVNKYLTTKATASNSAWYVMDLSTGLYPIIFQERLAPEIVSVVDPSDSSVFLRDEFLYGVRARFNFAYGNWRQIIRKEG